MFSETGWNSVSEPRITDLIHSFGGHLIDVGLK